MFHLLMHFSALPNPLSCFKAEPGSLPGNNCCPNTYIPHTGTVEACAALCLADTACQAIAMGDAGNPDSTDCRLSSNCSTPTAHLTAYNGYMRTTGVPGCGARGIAFHSQAGLFADGMILQRGNNTAVWGEGAQSGAAVVVSVGGVESVARAVAASDGSWKATLPPMTATASTTLSATDGATTVVLKGVAFGDVILCGEQVQN